MSCNVIKKITKSATTDPNILETQTLKNAQLTLEGAFMYLKEESTSKTSEMIVPWQSAKGRKEEPSIAINCPEQ